MNEQDRAWYNEWSREIYERKNSKQWQNDFAAEWYESMDRYREERAREKREIAFNDALDRFELRWGLDNGMGPNGDAYFDSWDPWSDCDDDLFGFWGRLDPGDYGFL